MTAYGWWPTTAARFREWRVNRAAYILVFVVAVIPWIIQWQALSHSAKQLVGITFTVSLAGEYTGDNISAQAMVALLLALVVFWNDWGRGRLTYILEGPISRQHIFLAKLWWCGLSVFAGGIVAALVVVLGSVSLHQPILLGGVVTSFGLILMARLSLVVTGLFVSSVVGNLIYLALSAWIVAEIPSLLGAVSAFVARALTGGNGSGVPGPRGFVIAYRGVQHFEPLSLTPSWHPGSWIDLFGYATWATLLTVWALRWWTRAAYERFADPFYFAWALNGVYAFWAALTATFFLTMSERASSPGTSSLVVWLLTFILGFLFWRGALSYWGAWSATRFHREPGPLKKKSGRRNVNGYRR